MEAQRPWQAAAQKTPVSVTRTSFAGSAPSPTKSYAPPKVFEPSRGSIGISTYRQFHRVFELPGTKSFKPPHLQSMSTAQMSSQSTARMSYGVPALSPNKSYAPPRGFQSKHGPFGTTTYREFHHEFKMPGTKNLKPPHLESASTAKMSGLSTTRLSYGFPDSSPTKSYAPIREWKPNPAPLGTSTNRADFRIH